MKEHNYFVYILTDKPNGKFYTGVTNNLGRRDWEHKNIGSVYTKKHNINMLMYYEHYKDVNEAIRREKLIKKWKRRYKIDAVERINPRWEDLYYKLNN